MNSPARSRSRIAHSLLAGFSNGQAVAPTDGCRLSVLGSVPLLSQQRLACQHGRRFTSFALVQSRVLLYCIRSIYFGCYRNFSESSVVDSSYFGHVRKSPEGQTGGKVRATRCAHA